MTDKTASHTPGFWEWCIDSLPSAIPPTSHTPGPLTIGTETTRGEISWHWPDKNLIRAAPDLLAALEDCADDLEAEIEARRGTVLPRTVERDLETVRKARAAIAKAKGGAL